ncbi:MAG: signal peptidase I [Firmicutes bacterium]|nr:signal peptidase I [Bacillota bacterium]
MRGRRYTTPEEIEAMRRVISRAKKERKPGLPGGRGISAAQKRKRALAIACSILFGILVLLLLVTLASIFMAKSRGEIPGVLGFHLFVVESGSMEPTLPVGTVILSRKPGDADRLQVKDIVTFKSASGAVVTHRIIDVIRDDEGNMSYRTKGDSPANYPDQELLTPERVIAVFVLAIPFT